MANYGNPRGKQKYPWGTAATAIGKLPRSTSRAFDPYNPTVPAGSYDPGLDSALYAAQRGLQDLTTDTQTSQQRGLIDYGLARGDIGTQQAREQQDYSTNVGLLTRKYGNLATGQQQQQNAYGVLNGGAVLQAAAKRAANQGLERTQLDTAHTRFGEDATQKLGQLGLGYQRGVDDSGLALLRGQRELGQFGIDTQGQRLFQASQAGYVAPVKPKNEFTSPGGTVYRVLRGGKSASQPPVYIDQYGRRLKGRPA